MSTDKASEKPVRIAKALARAGLCSRREAERWIADGRVNVNGQRLTSPAVTVKSADKVLVDGNPLPDAAPSRMWRYHKPAGMLTSHGDPQGRPTVFENLPASIGRVISVGRLDFNSEGLLLLTNDGELARNLEMPATGWTRRYRVRVHGKVDEEKLIDLKDGITISGIRYGPIQARLDREQGANAWLSVSLREGKNREVRKIMEHLGLTVTRLIRTAYGPFQLGNLERGRVDELSAKVLREQLGAATGANKLPKKDRSRKREGRRK
ncbi:MAG: rRNA pseudouridine synthase [Rhodospirillales bacterium]|nr:rRNA pseudouridine synthase [Rhodospirillales bacterium]